MRWSALRACGAFVISGFLLCSVAVHAADSSDAGRAAAAAASAASSAESAQNAADSAAASAKSANDAWANVPRSASDNYVGDCFKLKGNLPPLARMDGAGSVPVKRGDRLIVVSADPKDPNSLHVLLNNKDKDWFPLNALTECQTSEDTPDLLVTKGSDLTSHGAARMGWVYGVLALPFKYHFDDHSLDSAVSVGPYLGRRSEGLGWSWTWAMTAALSNVTGNTVDANGEKQDTSLMAFTAAGGLIFDVTKSVKPFRVGLFIGQDRVGRSATSTYKHNAKNWLALQIGFDFTDN